MKAYVNRKDNVKIKTLIIVLFIFSMTGRSSFVVIMTVCVFNFPGYLILRS